jgi:hypothetical protein
MAVAPLIKPIQTRKGMFYTFQSALEDLTLTFNNSINKFRFSKFALVRLPEIGTPSDIKKDNRIQFLAQGETPLLDNISLSNASLNLAQSFQNYALNLESLIISQESYQRDLKLNVSERVFWKWLKELGAVRWRAAGSSEVAPLAAGELRWAEDWAEASSTYSYPNANRVVQYIGDIDVINSVRSKDNSYSELYIHVPTNVGSSPTALFKSIADVNYYPGMYVTNSPGDLLDIEYLNGRSRSETHPSAGMNLRAYYDSDSNGVTKYISDTLNFQPSSTGQWYPNPNLLNAYFTDRKEFYGARSGTGTSTSSAPKIQRVLKTHSGRSVEYLRSTLDGVTLDTTLLDYLAASQNPNGVRSFAELNDTSGNYDFEFNAILVYYDVYEPGPGPTYDPISTSSIATNLYGVYFLNEPVSSGTDFIIPYITKEKPNAVNRTNGNAFAFKVNLKFDTSIEDVTVEKSVNDYSTVSLELFLDVLTEFKTLQTKYNDKLAELNQLALDVNAAKQALTNTSALDKLSTRVSQLETTVSASTEAFAQTTTLMDFIRDLENQIDDLYNNRTSLTLNYQLDALRQGYGIDLDRLTPGQLTFSSNSQNYSSLASGDLSSPSLNSSNIITLGLDRASTYFKHSRTNGTEWVLPANQEIRIDDSLFAWKAGQTFRLIIDTAIEPDSYLISIKTDAKNILSQTSPYGKTITTLGPPDFLGASVFRTKRPIIDITCVDPINLTFEVDKILR